VLSLPLCSSAGSCAAAAHLSPSSTHAPDPSQWLSGSVVTFAVDPDHPAPADQADALHQAVAQAGGRVSTAQHLGSGVTCVVVPPGPSAVPWLSRGVDLLSPAWLLRWGAGAVMVDGEGEG
jgi:hypothetical protein